MPKVLTDPGMGRCIGCYSCMQACARMVYNDFSPHKSAIQIRTVGGMNGRLVANICRACPEPVPCVEACPTGALVTREGGRGIKFYKNKCIGCELCVKACPVHVIGWDEEAERPIVCVFCGQCVKFCPHDCLEMVDVEELPQWFKTYPGRR